MQKLTKQDVINARLFISVASNIMLPVPNILCYKFQRFSQIGLKHGQDIFENQHLLQKVGEQRF